MPPPSMPLYGLRAARHVPGARAPPKRFREGLQAVVAGGAGAATRGASAAVGSPGARRALGLALGAFGRSPRLAGRA